MLLTPGLLDAILEVYEFLTRQRLLTYLHNTRTKRKLS